VVVSRKELLGHGVIRAENIESALSIEHCYNEIVVIGGSSIYEQTIEYADKLIITEIDAEAMADAYFPKIDKNIWKVNTVTEGGTTPYNFKFIEYIRNESSGIPRRETS
jgi:dihydrofolate reductase